MKKLFTITLFLNILIFDIYSIKFKIDPKDKTKQQLIVHTTIDTGFGIEGATDGQGVTDYQSYFFKTAFSIHQFGIGFDIKIRFRIFTTQPEFKESDWYVKDDSIRTLFLYLDKIDYIKFGSFDYPIFFTTGRIPYSTFGTGLLVNNFHNSSFMPMLRENGAYLRFDGSLLDKFGTINLPISATFICPDLLDPDIFIFNTKVEPFKLVKSIRGFNLTGEFNFAFDFDAKEANRLSALYEQGFQNHRNHQNNGWTTKILGFSIPVIFSYTNNDKFIFLFKSETSFLLNIIGKKFKSERDFNFANNFEIESKFIHIKDSGFLVGLSVGFILSKDDYFVNYFSSNYQIVRQLQYISNINEIGYILSVGLGLYAFEEKLQFKFKMYADMNKINYNEEKPSYSSFYSKFTIQFRLADTIVKGLSIDAFYETSMNEIGARDTNGGFFLRGITKNFRFFSEISYNIYSAKIKMIIGLQSPAWNTDSNYIVIDNPTLFDNDKYGKDLQKFVGVEVSFVL